MYDATYFRQNVIRLGAVFVTNMAVSLVELEKILLPR